MSNKKDVFGFWQIKNYDFEKDRSNGINVIPSIRWGDKYSWAFCFEGIKKHSLLAVGTLSALGTSEDIENFHKGFLEMINWTDTIKVQCLNCRKYRRNGNEKVRSEF